MLMARIILFWCFEKKIFLSRRMEFQVKFCHHSELRLWRTRMFFSTKSKCHKSNVRISWMYRYAFCDFKVHLWWPNKCFISCISSLNTLYISKFLFASYSMNLFLCHKYSIDWIQLQFFFNTSERSKEIRKFARSRNPVVIFHCSRKDLLIRSDDNPTTYITSS